MKSIHWMALPLLGDDFLLREEKRLQGVYKASSGRSLRMFKTSFQSVIMRSPFNSLLKMLGRHLKNIIFRLKNNENFITRKMIFRRTGESSFGVESAKS